MIEVHAIKCAKITLTDQASIKNRFLCELFNLTSRMMSFSLQMKCAQYFIKRKLISDLEWSTYPTGPGIGSPVGGGSSNDGFQGW